MAFKATEVLNQPVELDAVIANASGRLYRLRLGLVRDSKERGLMLHRRGFFTCRQVLGCTRNPAQPLAAVAASFGDVRAFFKQNEIALAANPTSLG